MSSAWGTEVDEVGNPTESNVPEFDVVVFD